MRQILSDLTYVVEMNKKTKLQMLLICLIMSRLGSNHDPKFFPFVEGLIRDSPTTRCEVITFSSCCLVPRIRNSVFIRIKF